MNFSVWAFAHAASAVAPCPYIIIIKERAGVIFCPFEWTGKMENKKYSSDDAVRLLAEKQAELNSAGITRYPRRSDFTEPEAAAVKAFLGPWPRALEKAGLKPPRSDDRLQKNREKRIRAKRKRRIALKEEEKTK